MTGAGRSLPGAALALLAGASIAQLLAQLPAPTASAFALCGLLPVLWRWPALRPFAWLALGFFWACLRGDLALAQRLPEEFAKRDFVVRGEVRDLPIRAADSHRFILQVRDAWLDGQPHPLRGRLSLAWYPDETSRRPGPCERWEVEVRLKPPRGAFNPGGFDVERQALARGITATGHVRGSAGQLLRAASPWCIDDVRERLAGAIREVLGQNPVAPLLQALAVADRRGLAEEDWELARTTGVSHLLAISGFHVGIAALFGAWLARFAWNLVPPGAGRRPRRLVEVGTALATALAYALLAGLGLPAQRALVMIAVACLALLLRRHARPVDALALALLAILFLDPLAVLAPGFWLSFAGVAFLLFGMVRAQGWRGWLLELGHAQLLMGVSLLPLTIWFFGQAPLTGVPANLLAVPVVSLLVVPLMLAGCLFWPVSTSLAALAWQAAGWITARLWEVLNLLASVPLARWHLPAPPLGIVLLATLGAIWLLWPRGMPARWLGALLFLPLLRPPPTLPPPGAFAASVLDVGQGLAVLVRTREHSLLYDAGPRFPSGFDAGRTIVVPALQRAGISRLDTLMISHGDNDHAGGARAVMRAWPQARLIGADGGRTGLPLQPCRKGRSWSWDGVEFRILHPEEGWREGSNDASCVVLVSGRGGRLLLTGDVTRLVEPDIAVAAGQGPPLVLLAPHHGSATSSSAGFLAALDPAMVLVSAGWLSQFGHPAAVVTERYHAAGIPWFNTGEDGALGVVFPADGAPRLDSRARCTARRYWRGGSCRPGAD